MRDELTIIKETYTPEIELSIDVDGDLEIYQQGDSVVVDKKQAIELIEALKKFISGE